MTYFNYLIKSQVKSTFITNVFKLFSYSIFKMIKFYIIN